MSEMFGVSRVRGSSGHGIGGTAISGAASERGRKGSWRRAVAAIAVMAAAAVGALAGCATATPGDAGPSATSAPAVPNSPAGENTPSPSASAPESSRPGEAVVPVGWEPRTSPSGTIVFAVDPEWTEMTEYARVGETTGGGTTEVIGSWFLESPDDALRVQLDALLDPGADFTAEREAEIALDAWANSLGLTAWAPEGDECFSTAAGLDACQISGSVQDVQLFEFSVTAVKGADAVIYVVVASLDDHHDPAKVARQVADSIALKDDAPADAPEPRASAPSTYGTVIDVAVPAEWAVHTSVSHTLTFAVDPTWDEDALSDPVENEGWYEYEWIGNWWHLYDVDVYIDAYRYFSVDDVVGVQREAEGLYESWSEDDDGASVLTVTDTSRLTTENGFHAYEILATGTGSNEGFLFAFINVEVGMNYVDVAVVCKEHSEAYDPSTVARTIAQSLAEP